MLLRAEQLSEQRRHISRGNDDLIHLLVIWEASEFPPFFHRQVLKCATTAWNWGDTNHTQRKKTEKINQDHILVGFITFVKCDQSNTVGAAFPVGWGVSGRINAGLTGSHRSTCETEEPSHLQDGHSCVMNGQNVADVVLRQQLLISCICNQRKRRYLAHLLHSTYVQRSWKTKANLGIFYPTTASSLNCPRQTWPSG